MANLRAIYGFLISAGVHAMAVAVLAVAMLPTPRSEEAPALVVSQWDGGDPLEVVEFEVPLAAPEASDFPVVGPPADRPLAVTAGDLDRVARGDVPSPSGASWGIGLPNGILTGSGGGGMIGEGSATFFGATVSGNRFVYVVDASRSMAGTRFRKAKRELFRSVANLRPDQQHYVIFFGFDTYPMYFPQPSPSLVPSGPESRKRLSLWMRRVDPNTQPATNGKTAMLLALALEPDAVYLLSDGAFTDDTVPALLSVGDNEIPIHTVAFGSEGARGDLQRIAEAHQGTYRFVR